MFDLDSYIEYLKKYSIDLLWDCDSFKGESLILIKADNHDDLFHGIIESMGMERRAAK